jgi:predicted alpha/beta hydrolase family esterase
MAKTLFNKKQIAKFILMMFIGLTYMVCAHAALPKTQTKIIAPVTLAQATPHREIVVLVHGLMRTSMSMGPLKIYLERHGYEAHVYSYPSPRHSIHEHAVRLHQYIEQLMAENPGVKVHFVTHSLGGIISREAVSNLSKKQFKNVGYLVMMAPPNQGSRLAKISTKIMPMISSAIKPLAELSSDQSAYVHHVPIPNIKMGIIAGRFDAKVPPSYARLQGQAEPIVINTTHTFIMNNATAKKLIVTFLDKGTFKE